MEKKNKEKKKIINEYNILGVNIQLVLTLLVVIFALLSYIVNRKFFSFFYLFIALDLFAMAYNNERIYRRENVTKAYIFAGVILLIYSILRFIGVV